MPVRGPVVLAALVMLVVLAGCGGAPAAPAPPPSPFPPRPFSVDLAGVDLCATLTAEQKRAREVDRQLPSVANVDGRPAPTCGWIDQETGADYSVQNIGFPASAALRGPGARALSIAGFGAVRGRDVPLSKPFCQIVVDVANERSVRVQYSGSYYEPDTNQDPRAVDRACGQAARLAEDVLGNLRP